MPPGRASLWSSLLVMKQLHLPQMQGNSSNQALLVQSPTSTSPFFHSAACFSVPVFQGIYTEGSRQKPKCLLLKVTASGSVLACPKLALFFRWVPEPHCCCYAAQKGSLKKKKRTTHATLQTQNAASHLQDVSETHGGWVQMRSTQTFLVENTWVPAEKMVLA